MKFRIAALLLVVVAFTGAPPALASIRGTAFSTTGGPVAGARVTAYRPTTELDARERLARGAQREALATATTNDDGAFAVEPKGGGVFEVIVMRDGYTPQSIYALDGESDLAVDLTAAEPRRGRVTAAGKPLPDALVVAEHLGRPMWSTRTDERGAFALPLPSTEWADQLRVIHPQHANFRTRIGAAQRSIDVPLARGTALTGKVTRAGGRAVAGARIFEDGWPVAVSAEDGTFTIAHANGKPLVAIAGTEHGSAPRGGSIELQPGTSIAGTVHDADKRPLPGAILAIWDGKGDTTFAVTDESGRYRSEHRAPIAHKVFALDIGELAFGMVEVNLSTNDTARADFTARVKTCLRGTVVDEKQRPIAGVFVFPMVNESRMLAGRPRMPEMTPATRTAADGRFRLALPPGYKFRLQALHPRYAPAVTEPMTMTATRTPVTITLHDGIEVRGVVTGTDDKPIAGAAVIAQEDAGSSITPIATALSENEVAPIVVSDAQGRFAIRLNDTAHDLGVWKEGYIGTTVTALKPERDAPPLKVVLERGVEIRGRVTSKSAGANVNGMIVAENDSGEERTTVTDATGGFVLASLSPGNYSVTFMSEDNLRAEKLVRAPAMDVVLELPLLAELRGRVRDKQSGEPVRHYTVTTEVTGQYSMPKTFDEETFALSVPQGDVDVTVTSEGFLPELVHATAGGENQAELTISLTPGRKISGRITSIEGLPLENATVSVGGEKGFRLPHVQSEDDGAFELTGVPSESVVLEIVRRGYVSRSVTVEAGERDHRVDVTLTKGRIAGGRVVSSAGAPVEGAQVWATPSRGSAFQHALSAADGTFEFEGLAEERYSIRASHDEHGSAELLDVDVTKPIVIAFKPSAGTGTIHGKVAGFAELGPVQGGVMAGERSAQIARDGTYKLERVPAGAVELRVTAYSTRVRFAMAPVRVTLAANEDLEVNLSVRSDLTLRGTITEGGQPIAAGVSVSFHNTDSNWSATTRDGGTYELTGIAPGAYDVIVDSRRGQFKTRYRVTGPATFDIAIAFAQLEGRVVAGGAPVAGATVEVTGEGRDEPQETTTDSGGAFRITLGESNSYVVMASKEGYANAVRRVVNPRAPVVLELTRATPLRVHLVDARNGQTLDGYVVVTDIAGMLAGRTDELVDDVLPVVLQPGAYRVSVSANGFASQSANAIIPRDGELRFALTPGGTLVISAESGAGELVKLVMPSGEEYVRCQCNRIAEIRLTGAMTTVDHVAPGRYTMYVYAEGGQVKSAHPVTIEEGQTASVTLE